MTSELKFQLAPGEVVELFQINGGQIDTLIRMPATAPALPRIGPRNAASVEIDGAGLRVITGARVDRLKDGEGYDARTTGMFVLSSPVGLEAIRQQIAKYAEDATLVDASRAIHLVHQRSATAGHTRSLPVPTEAAKLTLTAVPELTGHRAPWLDLARNISVVLGALMLIMFALMLALHRRERRRG
jgi:hypothetical protein